MADIVDNANEYVQREIDRAVSFRKSVPTRCECGEPCVVLPNGARARYCADCLAEFQGAGNG